MTLAYTQLQKKLGVYIIPVGKSEKKMADIKEALSDEFEMKDLGELHYFLSVKVIQDDKKGTIWIGQPVYTENILQKFGMEFGIGRNSSQLEKQQADLCRIIYS